MFWYNTCTGDEPKIEDYDRSWDNYLACQAISPSYTTKEAERLECDQLDTPNEDYWKCYWENEGCLETAFDDCWHTQFWFNTCELAGIGSNPVSLESYLASLNVERETENQVMNWGSLHASVTQKSVDVYLLELELLGLPRDERDNFVINFMKDFLVDLKDEQGNRNDIVLQDDITVMIVNKGSTPLKIGVSTPVLEVSVDEETEDDTPAEDSDD